MIRAASSADHTSPTPSSTAEWVEAASSNLALKSVVAEKVFETAERLAEVAEARTRELNCLEAAFRRVSKELRCYQLLEKKMLAEGWAESATIRRLKWSVVEEMKKSGRDEEEEGKEEEVAVD